MKRRDEHTIALSGQKIVEIRTPSIRGKPRWCADGHSWIHEHRIMTLNDTKYGRPLGEWSKMSEADRLADKNVGSRNIKRLNAMIAEALAVTSTTDAPPTAPPAE